MLSVKIKKKCSKDSWIPLLLKLTCIDETKSLKKNMRNGRKRSRMNLGCYCKEPISLIRGTKISVSVKSGLCLHLLADCFRSRWTRIPKDGDRWTSIRKDGGREEGLSHFSAMGFMASEKGCKRRKEECGLSAPRSQWEGMDHVKLKVVGSYRSMSRLS